MSGPPDQRTRGQSRPREEAVATGLLNVPVYRSADFHAPLDVDSRAREQCPEPFDSGSFAASAQDRLAEGIQAKQIPSGASHLLYPHNRTVPSQDRKASVFPSGGKAMLHTQSVCSFRVCRRLPSDTSHSRTVPSFDDENPPN